MFYSLFQSASVDPDANPVRLRTKLLSGGEVDQTMPLHEPCVIFIGDLPPGGTAPADSAPESRTYYFVAVPRTSGGERKRVRRMLLAPSSRSLVQL